VGHFDPCARWIIQGVGKHNGVTTVRSAECSTTTNFPEGSILRMICDIIFIVVVDMILPMDLKCAKICLII
jgi:hypothetical protein